MFVVLVFAPRTEVFGVDVGRIFVVLMVGEFPLSGGGFFWVLLVCLLGLISACSGLGPSVLVLFGF